ncbi:Hsp70 family protein [Clostridium sp. WILCCON 0269]|uniref:Chaperone protein DnaK n=1 Tax=Candidatus Clostridium eludens TaxID=3381663 RepID=A0ABW8SFQ2_9CLOT
MAGLEIKYSKYKLGIDLGTSTSVASIYINGKTRVLKINGKEYMPSVVSFMDKNTKLVGEEAKGRAVLDPVNTVSSIKRHMGEEGYKVSILEETYTPEQIASEILSKIVDAAYNQKDFEPEGSLYDAVICVPANFTDNAKIATKKAAEMAGLNVLSLLEEPVAAAIMYGFDSNKDQNVLVYDLGGGTFDVCVIKVQTKKNTMDRDKYKILSKEGIAQLGGDDFDRRIMEIINEDFKAKNNGIDLLDMEKDQGISKKKMKAAKQKLKEISENVKIELSFKNSTSVLFPNIIQTGEGELLHLDMEIAKDAFEQAISDLIDKTGETVKLALLNAKLTMEDIDKVILVGGSSLVPLVKSKIKEIFKVEPYSDFNPITIVAEGAAIFAASVGTPDEGNIFNIVTHNLGIMTEGMGFSKIIEKGIEIPRKASVIKEKEYRTQKDEQTEVSIYVYQSSEDISFVNEKNSEGKEKAVFIGEFKLSNIPSAPKGSEKIVVKFEVNEENIVKVTATSVSTGSQEEITLNVVKE